MTRLQGVSREPHQYFVAACLLMAAWRGLRWEREPGLDAWMAPGQGPPMRAPDLDQDDQLALRWLPGLGDYRASLVVRQRAGIQLPLTPDRLGLIAGVGEETAVEIHDWYLRHGLPTEWASVE